jgi:large subunit ribosomal protein L19e
MNLRNQRRLAAEVLGVGARRVAFDEDRLEDIAEAITRDDIRLLINNQAITVKPVKGISRGRARLRKEKKKASGSGRGHGSRKGTKKSRTPKKKAWIGKIRAIRDELRKMKERKELDEGMYRSLYRQAKGGLFHSRRHLREHVKKMEGA